MTLQESHPTPPGLWWAQITTPPRPSLTRDITTDVCVIGLGGSGLAAVRTARALGANVIGVDAGRIAGAAAGRNGGLLLGGMAEFHHDAVDRWGAEPATQLYHLTLAELQRMRETTPEHTWWRGSLRIAADDTEYADCEAQYERMQQDGLPVEYYEGNEGRGLLFPADGASQPVQRVHALAERAESEGAVLYEHTRVLSIAPGQVELAAGARIRASHIIVCADGALGALLPQLAPRLRQTRLQMLATAPAQDVSLPRPVYARYGYDYWQQLADGSIALGGGRDHFVNDEWTNSDQPSEPVQQYLEQQLRERVRTQAPVTHRWAATVTYTDDAAPIAEHIGNGIWAVGGYSGTGNVVGALCATGATRRALGNPDDFLDLLHSLRPVT